MTFSADDLDESNARQIESAFAKKVLSDERFRFTVAPNASPRQYLISVPYDESKLVSTQCTHRDGTFGRCDEEAAARVLKEDGRWDQLCADHAIHELGGHTDDDLQWEAEEQGWDSLEGDGS